MTFYRWIAVATLALGGAAAVPHAAGAAPAETQNCVETAGVSISADWTEATIADHESSGLLVTLSRIDTCGTVTGLGYQIDLPTSLYRADGSIDNQCNTVDVTASTGATSLIVANASIASGASSCTIEFPISGGASGVYPITAASISSVTGVAKNQTSKSLTITTATPRLSANFNPYTIAALASSTLRLRLSRSDENPAAVSSGLGFKLTLPSGLKVATGTPTNECGGTLTATVGATFVTLTGASLTGYPAECLATMKVTGTASGSYSLANSSLTDAAGVRPNMESNCVEQAKVRGKHKRTEGGCEPTLHINKIDQTITFPQTPNWSVSKHTVQLVATSDSGLPVSFTGYSNAVCTVSGTVVTLVSAGTCMLSANQEGNGTYNNAPGVEQSFTVLPPTAPPSQVVATAGVSQITASWQAPGDVTGVTGYIAIASPGQASCETDSAADTSCIMGGTAHVTYTIKVVTKNVLGNSAPTGPSNEATPTEPPITDTVPVTDLTLTTDKGLITTAEPSQDIVVIGTGFMPYSTATIVVYSLPIELGTVETDANGNFSKPVRVPATLTVGGHTLVAAGVGPNGAPHSLKMAIQVRGHALAVTGPPAQGMAQLALLAVLSGAGLLLAGRRRAVQ